MTAQSSATKASSEESTGSDANVSAALELARRSSRRLKYRLRRSVYSEGETLSSGEPRTPLPIPSVAGSDTAEVEALKAKLSEVNDQFLRARSDMDNLRKRFQKEREEHKKFANEGLIKGLLETVDNLERSIRGAEASKDLDALHTGVEMVHQQFINTLQRQGVEPVAPEPGDAFDPNIHEAVMVDENNPDFENDQIVECLQTGYQLHGRVLRAAMVRVAKK